MGGDAFEVVDTVDAQVVVSPALDLVLARDRVELTVPSATPVGAVWDMLPRGVAEAAPPEGLRYAVNHVWSIPGTPLRDGDEVALVLPVSGG